MRQEVRIPNYKSFKYFNAFILVLNDVFGRGIYFERVNIAINYDLPHDSDQLSHYVGYAGRVLSKGCCDVFQI